MHKYRKEYESEPRTMSYESWLENELECCATIATNALTGIMGFRATYFDVFNRKGMERVAKPEIGDLGIVTACHPKEPYIDTVGILIKHQDDLSDFVIRRLDGTECRWGNAKFVSLGMKLELIEVPSHINDDWSPAPPSMALIAAPFCFPARFDIC